MSFRESFYATKQLLVNRLQDFGLVSANMNMGWTTLLTIAQNTRVTIDVPLILTYSDAFLISGTLETSTYSRLNGKTVKLKVGNTIVDTTTTNANGEYSFTHSPVSTGNHSFQVVFEGTNIHSASESSVVTRAVGKETSVMNLDAISTQHYGDTVIFGGQLLTDDGEYISNASVKYYLDNTLIDTLTTNAQGRFSTSKTINNFDTLDVDFVYDGDSNYVDCSANTSINVYQKVLSLTADKSILDYSSNESAILTAQIKDTSGQNLPISGEEVKFGIVNDEIPSPSSSTVQSTMVVLEYTGNSIGIGDEVHNIVMSTGDVLIDWGDGSSDTINNSTKDINHSYYTDGVNNHTIKLIGEITSLGPKLLYYNTGLTGVVIPDTVTSLGNDCFYYCTGLVDYQLYWTGDNIIPYNNKKMPNNTNTIFTIPQGETSNYVAKGYPSAKLQERIPTTTDATGKVTYTYESTGAGDVTIYAQCGLLQETFVVEDCQYFNDGSTVTGLEIDSEVSCTTNGSYITITKSTNGEKYVRLPINTPSSGDWEFSVELAAEGVTNWITFDIDGGTWWGAGNDGNSLIHLNESTQTISSGWSVGDVLKLKYISGTITAYKNDTSLRSKSNQTITNKPIGVYTNNGRVQNIKNIKVKAL